MSEITAIVTKRSASPTLQLRVTTLPLRSADLNAPIMVLSAAPKRTVFYPAAVLVAVLLHLLIGVGFTRSPSASASKSDTETFEVITEKQPSQPLATEVPDAETQPPPNQADDPNAPAAMSEPLPPDSPAPDPPAPDAPSPQPDLAPAVEPSIAPESASPEPQITGVASPSADAAQPIQPPPPVVAARSQMPRHPTRAAPARARQTDAVAMVSARPAAAEDKPADAAMTARIRTAVQAAARCPPAARMMAQSGKAAIAFDYRDGAVLHDVQVVQSSGTPALDAAALTAVRSAHYPQPQPADLNRVFHLLIWVEEACGG